MPDFSRCFLLEKIRKQVLHWSKFLAVFNDDEKARKSAEGVYGDFAKIRKLQNCGKEYYIGEKERFTFFGA